MTPARPKKHRDMGVNTTIMYSTVINHFKGYYAFLALQDITMI